MFACLVALSHQRRLDKLNSNLADNSCLGRWRNLDKCFPSAKFHSLQDWFLIVINPRIALVHRIRKYQIHSNTIHSIHCQCISWPYHLVVGSDVTNLTTLQPSNSSLWREVSEFSLKSDPEQYHVVWYKQRIILLDRGF